MAEQVLQGALLGLHDLSEVIELSLQVGQHRHHVQRRQQWLRAHRARREAARAAVARLVERIAAGAVRSGVLALTLPPAST